MGRRVDPAVIRALAELVGGANRGLIAGLQIGEHRKDRAARMEEGRLDRESREKIAGMRAGAKGDMGEDAVRYMLGITPGSSIPDTARKTQVPAAYRIIELAEKGMDPEAIVSELSLVPTKTRVRSTSPLGLLIRDEVSEKGETKKVPRKADASGMIDVTPEDMTRLMEDNEWSPEAMKIIKDFKGFASSSEQFGEHGQAMIRGMAQRYQRWRGTQGLHTQTPAAPASRPGTPRLPPPPPGTPEMGGAAMGGMMGMNRTPPRTRAEAVARSTTDEEDYISHDPVRAIRGWQGVVTTRDPLAPPPTWIPGIERILPSLMQQMQGQQPGPGEEEPPQPAATGPQHPADVIRGTAGMKQKQAPMGPSSRPDSRPSFSGYRSSGIERPLR